MKWRTIIEVPKILPDDATATQAVCTAAVEAARAVCCLARTGSICFNIFGNSVENCSTNTRKRNKMKDDCEGRWKWKKEEEENSRLSLSSSVHVDISDSGSAEKMSQQALQIEGQI